MKRQKTEQQVLESLASICSRAEHCTADLEEKLRRWNVPADARMRIIARLEHEGYVDDSRYAELFVSEKVNIAGWGRRKIEQALRMKHIDSSTYAPYLDAVTEEEWLSHLRPLLKSKAASLPPLDEWQRSARLMRFALSRGFEMQQIRICLDESGLPDDADMPNSLAE